VPAPRPGPCPLTRTGRCRGHPAASHAATGPRQGRFASLRDRLRRPLTRARAARAGVDELLARIRAVTRRLSNPDAAPTARIGRYRADLTDRRVEDIERSGHGVHLTPIEWKLLEVLVRNPGKLVSQRQLLHETWGPTYTRETDYLRQYMKHLRRKLEDDPARPRQLITEPGMGYRFQAIPDSQPAISDPSSS
jgi:DNA-binding winged helix-turn-helix (wHTH) protein